jgi:hypothetical protein
LLPSFDPKVEAFESESHVRVHLTERSQNGFDICKESVAKSLAET